MRAFLKVLSYLVHPLSAPLTGVCLFFFLTPKQIDDSLQYEIYYKIATLTIIFPIVFYFFLEKANVVNTLFLSNIKERKIPLLIHCFINYTILSIVIPKNLMIELYFFFTGIFIAGFVCLIAVIIGSKTSLHMAAISGLAGFTIFLNIYYQYNYTILIGTLIILCGAIATNRLLEKAHTPFEVVTGTLIGIIPQFIPIFYWFK